MLKSHLCSKKLAQNQSSRTLWYRDQSLLFQQCKKQLLFFYSKGIVVDLLVGSNFTESPEKNTWQYSFSHSTHRSVSAPGFPKEPAGINVQFRPEIYASGPRISVLFHGCFRMWRDGSIHIFCKNMYVIISVMALACMYIIPQKYSKCDHTHL